MSFELTSRSRGHGAFPWTVVVVDSSSLCVRLDKAAVWAFSFSNVLRRFLDRLLSLMWEHRMYSRWTVSNVCVCVFYQYCGFPWATEKENNILWLMLHSRRFNTRVNCSSLLFFLFLIAFLVKRGLVLLSLQFVFVLSISHFFTTFFSFLLFFFFTSFLSYVTRQHGVMRVLRAQGKVLSVFRFFFFWTQRVTWALIVQRTPKDP